MWARGGRRGPRTFERAGQRSTFGLVMEGVRVRSLLPDSASGAQGDGHAKRGRARRLCATCKCARTPAHLAPDQPRAPCAARQARAARGAARIPPACLSLLGVLLVAAAQADPDKGADRVEDVLAEMRRHPADAGVQEQGCGALWSFNVNADNKVKIAAAGGVADVLAAMRAHRSHAGVQVQGCGALWSLAGNNADNKVKIAAAGGIADVLAAMRAHRSHAEVQDLCCGALLSLAGNNADNKVKIAVAGGIADVLAAMRAHRSHAGVQEQGCGALFNLALHTDNQVKIAAAGGIADVLAAMRAHKGTSRVEDFACRTLHKLGQSVDGNVSKALLESEAVPTVRAATSEGCKRWGQQMIDGLQERGAEL